MTNMYTFRRQYRFYGWEYRSLDCVFTAAKQGHICCWYGCCSRQNDDCSGVCGPNHLKFWVLTHNHSLYQLGMWNIKILFFNMPKNVFAWTPNCIRILPFYWLPMDIYFIFMTDLLYSIERLQIIVIVF